MASFEIIDALNKLERQIGADDLNIPDPIARNIGCPPERLAILTEFVIRKNNSPALDRSDEGFPFGIVTDKGIQVGHPALGRPAPAGMNARQALTLPVGEP